MTKILVTGAAGKLGSATIHHVLETSGIAPADIVAGSRDTSKLADLAARGIEIRKVDFDDQPRAAVLEIELWLIGQPHFPIVDRRVELAE